jgi:hypothetical protein
VNVHDAYAASLLHEPVHGAAAHDGDLFGKGGRDRGEVDDPGLR